MKLPSRMLELIKRKQSTRGRSRQGFIQVSQNRAAQPSTVAAMPFCACAPPVAERWRPGPTAGNDFGYAERGGVWFWGGGGHADEGHAFPSGAAVPGQWWPGYREGRATALPAALSCLA